VVGAPAITALAGGDPAPALRILIVGTAILPLTAPPVFWLAPGLGEAGAVARAALRLTAVIAGAVALAALTRRLIPEARREAALRAADGLTVLALAVLVVGLMAAVGPALRAPDAAGMAALGAALAANLGLQALAWVGYGAAGLRKERVALAVTAGNRNMALFLIALPPETTDPLLGFIGFYQIPMFLTPLLLGALAAQPLSRRM
jgi:predicted Na+-dependent transporter